MASKPHLNLKKPSQFVNSKTKELKSPSIFTKQKELSNHDQALCYEQLKRDSSNVKQTSCKPVTQNETSKLLSPIVFMHNQEYSGRLFDIEFTKNRNCNKTTQLQMPQHRECLDKIKQDNQVKVSTDNNNFKRHKNVVEIDKNYQLTQIQNVEKDLMRKKFNDLQNEFNTLENEMKQCNKYVETLQTENLMLKTRNESTERQHFNELKKLYENYIQTQNQIESEKTQLKYEAEKSMTNFTEKLNQKEKEIVDSKKCIEELKHQNCILTQTQNIDKQEICTLKKQIENQNIKFENQKLINGELSSKLNNMVIQIESLNRDLANNQLLVREKEVLLNNKKNENCADKASSIKECAALNEKIIELSHELASEREKTKMLQSIIEDQSYKLKVNSDKLLAFDNEFSDEKKHYAADTDNKILYLENKLMEKDKEVTELNNDFFSLQKTNKLLHIRYETLNEMLDIQNKVEVAVDDGSEQLLNAWRKKVYQMLVAWKTHESECLKR